MRALLTILSIVILMPGCARHSDRSQTGPIDICDVRDHFPELAGKVVVADAVVSESMHTIVVTSAACPEIGLRYDEDKAPSVDNRRSLDRLDQLLDQSYKESRFSADFKGVKVVSVRLTGTLIRGSGTFTGIAFRAQRAENPKVVDQPEAIRLIEEQLVPKSSN